MRWIKLAALFILWSVFFVLTVLTHLAVSVLRLPRRWRIVSKLTQGFASLLRILLNVKITVEGNPQNLKSGGYFIVSNHFGYLDGFVLGSLCPVIYVSKREVRQWPLIGPWTALCGTIYIDRRRKDKIPLLVEEINKKLRQKANILLFPEGTSSNGETLLPFQTAPFAAPLRARAPIVPVTLTYKRINHQPLSIINRDEVYWYGDMEFVGHFWNLLAVRSIEVLVQIHPEIETARHENNSLSRKQLSLACYEAITRGMKPGDEGGQRDKRHQRLS